LGYGYYQGKNDEPYLSLHDQQPQDQQEREQQELGSLLRVYLLLLQLRPSRQEAMLSLPLQHQP
jgi:hypothetical protein